MALLDLPALVVENIFSYLTYDEVARNRIVSKSFNDICMRMLNRGFMMIERRHALALKSVKSQLPRRESERRYHPLARHCDILTSIETRISMLNMTYSKFIDNGLCCFVPGRVIDEIRRVLSLVETSAAPPRAHEVLQELRDISSMAIEHFDDKVAPAFRKKLQEGIAQPPPRPSQAAILTPLGLGPEVMFLRRKCVLNAKLSLYLVSKYKFFHTQMMVFKRIAFRQRKALRELIKRQKEQKSTIADLKKRIEECDIKYSELTHTNQAAGGKSITASPDTASSAQTLRHFGSQIKLDLSVLPIGTSKRNNKILPNIKPRKSHIKLPGIKQQDVEEVTSNPPPSTSGQTPRPTVQKIRGYTSEIRYLSNLAQNLEGKLKRANSSCDEPDSKKLTKLE